MLFCATTPFHKEKDFLRIEVAIWEDKTIIVKTSAGEYFDASLVGSLIS